MSVSMQKRSTRLTPAYMAGLFKRHQQLADVLFVRMVGQLLDVQATADEIVTFYPHWEEGR